MDYISISGERLRVEANFNALCTYMDIKGVKDLSFLSSDLSMGDWLLLMAVCINEGERLDGKDRHITPVELGEHSVAESSAAIRDFIAIFSKQNGSDASTKKK